MTEVVPMSFDAFCELPESADMHTRDEMLEAFTLHSMAYWLQQNADRVGDPAYKKMEAHFEDSTI